MPNLNESTDDIEPVVLQLRAAAKTIPILSFLYFAIQFIALGSIWGAFGMIIGGILGVLLGILVSSLIAPIYSWQIHTLFLLHGIRENQRRVDREN